MSFLLHKLVLKTFFSVFSVRNLQYGPRTRLVEGIEYRNVGAFYTCVLMKGYKPDFEITKELFLLECLKTREVNGNTK